MFTRYYTIYESEEYCAARDAISTDVRRIDDLLDAIMWGLGQDPHQFSQISGNLWMAKTDPYPDAPALRVWFLLENPEFEIHLLHIETIEDGA